MEMNSRQMGQEVRFSPQSRQVCKKFHIIIKSSIYHKNLKFYNFIFLSNFLSGLKGDKDRKMDRERER